MGVYVRVCVRGVCEGCVVGGVPGKGSEAVTDMFLQCKVLADIYSTSTPHLTN